MELRQLRYFVIVADLKNFTRAAGAVHIAQPALSRQIRKLEEELGGALFYRDGRTVTLTEAGRKFYNHAKSMLRSIEAARRELSEEQNSPTGSVVFGVPPHLGPQFSIDVFSQFERVFPRARLHIVEAFSGQLADWLFTGRLDLAFLYNADSYKHLTTVFSVTESLYVVTPPGDKMAVAESVQFNDLEGLPFIAFEVPSNTRNCVEVAVDQTGTKINFATEIDSTSIIKRLVAKGKGYAFFPYVAVHEEVQAGLLSAVKVVNPLLEMRLSLAVPQSGETTGLSKELTAIVSTAAKEAIANKTWSARINPKPRRRI